MEKLAALFGVLKSGAEIGDKVKAKNGTLAINNIVVFIAACIYFLNTFDCSFCDFQLTNDQLVGISSAIVTVIGLFNNISHAATSVHATINPIENVKIALAKKELPVVDQELAQKIRENQNV